MGDQSHALGADLVDDRIADGGLARARSARQSDYEGAAPRPVLVSTSGPDPAGRAHRLPLAAFCSAFMRALACRRASI